MTQHHTPGYQALVCTHFGSWRDLEIRRLERPVLQSGQVRIRVRHAGVGFAVGLFVSGKYQRKPPLPFTPGTEASGEIIECSPDVTHLQPGQRVVAALDWGAFAQETVIMADTVYPVPDALDLRLAAALPITYGTAWGALIGRARLQAGETLLVHGASGALGMAAVQIGRLAGARVIATASTEAKRDAALANGAHHVLPAEATTLAAAVKQLTGHTGIDVVFDPVGGDLFDASLRCLAIEARILIIGFAAGRIPETPSNLLLLKNASLIGYNYGQYIGWGLVDERRRYAGVLQPMLARMLTAFAIKQMPPPLTQHFDFSDWIQALDTTLSRRAIGKVVLDI